MVLMERIEIKTWCGRSMGNFEARLGLSTRMLFGCRMSPCAADAGGRFFFPSAGLGTAAALAIDKVSASTSVSPSTALETITPTLPHVRRASSTRMRTIWKLLGDSARSSVLVRS